MRRQGPLGLIDRGIGFFAACLGLVIASVITAVAGAPPVIPRILLILILPCAIAGYVIGARGAKRARKEDEARTARALQRIRQPTSRDKTRKDRFGR